MTASEFFQMLVDIALVPLIAGALITLCAALLGVILVLKKYSLIGHGLADVGFAAMSIAIAIGISPMYITVPIVVAAGFLIMFISQKKGVSGDVAISVAATASLAVGIIVAAMTKGFNTDIAALMFGSILAVTTQDLIAAVALAAVVLTLYILFFNRLFLITADETFAKAQGINIGFYQFMIAFLTALTVVVGMRITGSLLISSLIVFPAISARSISRSFRQTVIFAAAIGFFSFITGFFVSLALNVPVGACIVAVNVVVMLLLKILGVILSSRKAR